MPKLIEEYGNAHEIYEDLGHARSLNETLLAALQVVMDQVDYTAGACRVNEMVGACLPESAIARAHEAIEKGRAALR